MLLALEYAPGLGAEAMVPGDSAYVRCGVDSSKLVVWDEVGRGGLRIDLMDDKRLLLSGSHGVP